MELADFKGQYDGRIFLAGNGPSMNLLTEQQKKQLSTKEYTFSGSRWFKWAGGWTTDFYILTERKQADNWKERGFANASANIAKFWVTWQPAPAGWVPVPRPPSNAHDVLNYGTKGLWHCQKGVDPGQPHLHHGKDTPLAMAQVATYMGFQELYLIGCETEGTSRSYQDEPRQMHTAGIMRGYYERAGRELPLVDCTFNGMLGREGILPYRDLDEVLSEGGNGI